MAFYTARRDLYSSKAASDVTSETYWVGDARTISMSVRGSPSTTTIQGTNADGRSAVIAEAEWSDLTVVVAPSPDMLDIAPGFRWMRTLRSETTEVILELQNQVY